MKYRIVRDDSKSTGNPFVYGNYHEVYWIEKLVTKKKWFGFGEEYQVWVRHSYYLSQLSAERKVGGWRNPRPTVEKEIVLEIE